MLKQWLLPFLFALTVPLLLLFVAHQEMARIKLSDEPPQHEPFLRQRTVTADHSQFEILQGPFETGPDVTAACLTCHTEAAQQVMGTTHWTWTYFNEQTGQELGKLNTINNFCVAFPSNEGRCSSCHVGYGWRDNTYDLSIETNVDCLVCHDTTGTYEKFPTGAGHPTYVEQDFGGRTWYPPDLVHVAQNIGPPSRATCGSCHFSGGGGDAVKHADLDSSLLAPSVDLDVHMAADGLNFDCTVCHSAINHQIGGSRYAPTVADMSGVDTPASGDYNHATCASCHALDVHENHYINRHIDTLACETCHIPSYGRGQPLKMSWDWSTAGEMNEDGGRMILRDDDGFVIYDSQKGGFTWDFEVVPEYLWTRGEITFATIGDTLILPEDGEPYRINDPISEPRAEGARIWPARAFTGLQPYDPVNEMFIIPHLFPTGPDDQTAYWRNYDWVASAQYGMDYVGLPFSGEVDFLETVMYWPIDHMVAPANQALTCTSCHSRDGRLAGVEGVYIPGQHSHPLLTVLGVLSIGGGLAGASVHGVLRFRSGRRRKQRVDSILNEGGSS